MDTNFKTNTSKLKIPPASLLLGSSNKSRSSVKEINRVVTICHDEASETKTFQELSLVLWTGFGHLSHGVFSHNFHHFLELIGFDFGECFRLGNFEVTELLVKPQSADFDFGSVL